ncbi:MAG: protease modulator HflC, partial [Gammaproteobacteria bacterium]|nr:protease modulator HflC [Gammaproteobacteria bacterium]
MNQNKMLAIAGLFLLLLVITSSAVYVVDEREKAVVVRFGEVIRYDDAPGIHWKQPFLDSVRFYSS